MIAIRRKKLVKNNQITVHLPSEYENKQVEVIILSNEKSAPALNKYDFSDLAGKFRSDGDAVAEQRKLRDEWK